MVICDSELLKDKLEIYRQLANQKTKNWKQKGIVDDKVEEYSFYLFQVREKNLKNKLL